MLYIVFTDSTFLLWAQNQGRQWRRHKVRRIHSRFYHSRKLSHRSRTDCKIWSMAQKLLAKQLCPEFQQGSGPKRNYYRLHYQGNICPRYSNSPQVPYKEKGEGFQGQTGIQKQSWWRKNSPLFPHDRKITLSTLVS